MFKPTVHQLLLPLCRAVEREKGNLCTSLGELKCRTTKERKTQVNTTTQQPSLRLRWQTQAPSLIQKYCTELACLDVIKCSVSMSLKGVVSYCLFSIIWYVVHQDTFLRLGLMILEVSAFSFPEKYFRD